MGLSQTGTQTSESQRGWAGGKRVPAAADAATAAASALARDRLAV